ncbi:MAG: NAD(P)/FAD-dependent oxidoreductase [Caulobacterales bacterium]
MSDIVVVGGGLAGGSAAALLAQAGKRPLLLEREREPRDKICGEFLSTEAQAHLAHLGFDVAALGGSPIDKVRLVVGDRGVESPLPFKALGLTRRRLDAALLDYAAGQGAEIARGVAARSVFAGAVATTDGDLRPAKLLLASGKHDVRGARRDTRGTLTGLVGFKSYFRVDAEVRRAMAGYVEVVLFEGGYAGLQLVEGGLANLCLLVGRERLDDAGRNWPSLLQTLLAEPHLGRRLAAAEQVGDHPLSIADVPYGFIHHDRQDAPEGFFRLGDQAAVIPSFSGDGMSIALHSGRLAAQAVLAGASARDYHQRLRRDVRRQIGLAVNLQRWANSATGRLATVGALSLAPGLMRMIAARTRLPEAALRRSGLTTTPVVEAGR